MSRFALLVLPVLLAACGRTPCPGVQYEGRATDEAYLSMEDAEERAVPDPSPAPSMQFADGMSFAASPPPTLKWTSTLSAARLPRPLRRESPGRAPLWRGLILAEAWAHLPPVTGAIFWLKLSTPGQSCAIELLTTNTEWTPLPQVWSLIAQGTGPTQLTGYSAYLNENRITEGPYVSPAPTTFRVLR
jgi:hypothetical protein